VTRGPFTNDSHRLAKLLTSGDIDAPSYLPVETYDTILSMIYKYTARQRQQRRLRLLHFCGETCIAIGCLVAVWWSPHNYVSFILMLLSTVGFAAGVLDGLIGGFFVSSELRALKEFEWEIVNARKAAVAPASTNDILNNVDDADRVVTGTTGSSTAKEVIEV
jgi:sphingomyelin phosphodiesterase 2